MHRWLPRFLVCREPPLIKPSVNRPVPVSTTEQQQVFVGGKSTISHSPSPHKAISSSSCRTLQTIPQNSNHRADTLPLEGQGRSVILDESERGRSSDIPKTPAADTQEMSAFFVQDLWPQDPTSEIIDNSTSLRWRTRCIMMRLQTYGRSGIEAGMQQPRR